MSKVTRFAGRDPGPAARMAGFMAHLRVHGFSLGVAETQTAMEALGMAGALAPEAARLALKTVCAGRQSDVEAFDALFDSYWMNDGRVRDKVVPSLKAPSADHLRSTRHQEGIESDGAGTPHSPDEGGAGGDVEADGTGRLVASELKNLMKKDVREMVTAEEIRAAEAVALRLGRALRDRRSRRRKAAARGRAIDLRRTARRSLATGGEPLRLARRVRPERPVRIVAICDVSGSMMIYARVFLAFLAGLMRADPASEAFLFHTRLVGISDALRDEDPMRALNRVTLLANGIGGGTRIGGALGEFARGPARRCVDGRSVVIVLSDGYDSEGPDQIGAALARIKWRGAKTIWLNPLKGWSGYAPIAAGMAAALPHLDLFRAAGTLADLAALETELARL